MFNCFKKKVIETSPVKSEPELPPLPVKDVKIVRYPRCNREMTTRLERLWNTCEIKPQFQREVISAKNNCISGINRYLAVSKIVHIPWEILAVIHKMEGACNFNAVMHNGERIIGTGRKTILVPKGRGPFATWEESCIDAIGVESKRPVGFKFDIANTLYYLTMFNGFGYENKGINTPYLWSYTNHYTKGKYVSDGKYDPNAASKQCGAVPVLKALGWEPESF
jgi:lysozyme family protein